MAAKGMTFKHNPLPKASASGMQRTQMRVKAMEQKAWDHMLDELEKPRIMKEPQKYKLPKGYKRNG